MDQVSIWIWVILIGYFLSMACIFVFAMGQMHLAMMAYFKKPATHVAAAEDTSSGKKELPFVTIQLPIYNEPYVVERLLRTVAAVRYPTDKWEIQILDDSTDDTTQKIHALLPQLRTDVPMYHLCRTHRSGYKAGALAAATAQAKGEFIAIFDADFLPPPDFLMRTVSHFAAAPRLGFVQACWGHLNEGQNLLTRLQAFGLNGHFVIEQATRHHQGYFMHFNGTAGIWRKRCIIDAGGWQSSTLTEDLDLSYRAQLLGWQGRYLPEVVCPAELPIHMGDVKQQQKRWCKGAAQTAKKHIPALLKARLPWLKRVHGLLHLLNSSVYPCVLLSSLLSVPLLYAKVQHPALKGWLEYGSIFLLGFVGFCLFYLVAARKMRPQRSGQYLITHLFWFLSISMALARVNGPSVVAAWLGIQSPFRRTPKQGNQSHKSYRTPISVTARLMDGSMALYFAAGIGYGLYVGDHSFLFFHALLMLGYGSICWYK